MPRARKHLVCLSETPYYLITSRCVRRAFLCGSDRFTGKSYEHRRQWIEDRIRVLSSLFCIDICAYAVMSNHYHLVVKINPNEADQWSDDEVLMRWTSLFRGPILIQRYRSGESMEPIELETVQSMISVYRSRLQSLSWFMKCLNEPIARKANAEDQCTGHFWEARFDSAPLLSEQALLTAMAYVDLNPIRAKMSATPEESDYTSIKARIGKGQTGHDVREAISRLLEIGELNHFNTATKSLKAFSTRKQMQHSMQLSGTTSEHDDLPIYKDEYLKLVDMTGRILVSGKRGRIDPGLAPILERLNISADQWVQASCSFRQYFKRGVLRLKSAA